MPVLVVLSARAAVARNRFRCATNESVPERYRKPTRALGRRYYLAGEGLSLMSH
jgi:hypothetical protein